MSYNRKKDPDYITDDGPPCPQCTGHCYGYQCLGYGHLISVRCWGCHRLDSFAIPARAKYPETAAEYKQAHHYAAGTRRRPDPDPAISPSRPGRKRCDRPMVE